MIAFGTTCFACLHKIGSILSTFYGQFCGSNTKPEMMSSLRVLHQADPVLGPTEESEDDIVLGKGHALMRMLADIALTFPYHIHHDARICLLVQQGGNTQANPNRAKDWNVVPHKKLAPTATSSEPHPGQEPQPSALNPYLLTLGPKPLFFPACRKYVSTSDFSVTWASFWQCCWPARLCWCFLWIGVTLEALGS